jgi:hypothetical protein
MKICQSRKDGIAFLIYLYLFYGTGACVPTQEKENPGMDAAFIAEY